MKLPKILAAILDIAEPSPDRSNRATWGDRYNNLPEDRAIPQSERLAAISECRDLVRNSAVARGIVERVRNIVTGTTGILPESNSGDKAWDDKAEALWREWAADPEGTGRSDLADIQGLLAASTLTDGGTLVALNQDGSITLIEPDRLKPDPAGRALDQPYKLDPQGRVTAWCVHTKALNPYDKDAVEWLDARRCLTLFVRNRADQILPYPQFSACALTLRDIEELNRYTLRQAKVQSCAAAIHKRGPSGESPFRLRGVADSGRDKEEEGAQRFEKATGMTVIDTDGDYNTLAPATPSSTYDSFMKHNLRLVAMAVGLPYEFLALYFADGTYSSSKATMTQAREAVAYRQRHLKRAILTPLWQWQVARWTALGLLPPAPAGATVRWRDPAFEWMDVKDGVQTDLLEAQAGLRSMQDLAAKRGADYETLLRRRAAEIKTLQTIAAEYGLDPAALSSISLPGAAKPANS